MLQIIAKKEYADRIIYNKAQLAQNYNDVVAQKLKVPKLSFLRYQEQELDEIERKIKFINTMNSIIELVNVGHDRSNPITESSENTVILEQSIAEKSPKRLMEREGIVYSLDDEDYLSLVKYIKKNQISLKCGDVTITVSPDLIDMQFGEKEGIFFSTKEIIYYQLPDTKKRLFEEGIYELKPEWYSCDLSEELIEKHDDIIGLISASISHIENEELRENVLQNFNYLLVRARLDTITHIPDERDKKLETLKEMVIRYREEIKGQNEELKRENEELKRKCDETKIDEIF